MDFLADENFPLASVQLLISNNHNVRQASIVFQSNPDEVLLEKASIAGEIILTFDKDFGELIFKKQIPGSYGIILFRLQNYLPTTPAIILLDILKSDIQLHNYLTVIDKTKIRQRPIK